MTQIKGIDVSKHQGKIDWQKVKADGVEFAIIRAGWTWYDGGMDIDTCFTYNIENAIKHGIKCGVYVYSYDRSFLAAKISARKLIELIKPYKLEYPVVFDIEYEQWNKTTGKGKLNTDITIAFLEEIEKAGYYSMVYASTDFFNNFLELNRLDKYDKWVAEYRNTCSLKKPYGIWQYFNQGKVNGINGNADMDWSYKDYSAIIRNAGLNHLTAEKPIIPEKPKTISIEEYTKVKTELNTALSNISKYESQIEMLKLNADKLRNDYNVLINDKNTLDKNVEELNIQLAEKDKTINEFEIDELDIIIETQEKEIKHLKDELALKSDVKEITVSEALIVLLKAIKKMFGK